VPTHVQSDQSGVYSDYQKPFTLLSLQYTSPGRQPQIAATVNRRVHDNWRRSACRHFLG
jgi:hypothetical protein